MNDGDSSENNIEEMCQAIERGTYKMICVNESEVEHFEETKQKVIQAFEVLLSEKSEFER